MLSDTSPEAERVQIELLRKATIAQRIGLARSLTALVVRMSRSAIARANPGLSPEELDIKYVEITYGSELADGLRERLRGNSQ